MSEKKPFSLTSKPLGFKFFPILKKWLALFSSLAFILPACAQNQSKKAVDGLNRGIKLEIITSDLIAPLDFADPNDGTGRYFIVEQKGRVRILENGKLRTQPLIDITDLMVKLNKFYSEKGLLGMAIHPKFTDNGKFYLYYGALTQTPDMDHKCILSEFRISQTDRNKADGSERIILEVEEPESNHNGGQIAFGNDGYLYVGLGDGGGSGDKHGIIGNGQNTNTLLGKILRIDVDTTVGYKIPKDNPYAHTDGFRPEIWAYGLRNPWRFSFDRANGKLFCGDVGQNSFEEIDIIEKGKNYGWRVMEGRTCFDAQTPCDQTQYVLPIDVYPREVGYCVIGGFVYRGKLATEMVGKYIFGDWSGRLFYLTEMPDKKWIRQKLILANNKDNNIYKYITAFGQDSQGEIYILTNDTSMPLGKSGKLYKIIFN